MKKARHLLICLAVILAMVFTSFASFAATGSDLKPVTGNKSNAVAKELDKGQLSSKDKAKLEEFMKSRNSSPTRMGISSYSDPIGDSDDYIRIYYPEDYDEYCIGNSMGVEFAVYDTWESYYTIPVSGMFDIDGNLIEIKMGGVADKDCWTDFSGSVYFDPSKYSPGVYEFAILNVPCNSIGVPIEGWDQWTDIPEASVIIGLDNHSFGPWNVTKNATEVNPGAKSHTCAYCHRTFTASIAQLSPTLPKVSIKKPKAGKKSMTVKWKKVSKKNQKKIAKIEVQFSQDRNFKTGVYHGFAKSKSTSAKIKKLASKKTYYVRIRAYKVSGGAVHVSAWSAVKAVKVK